MPKYMIIILVKPVTENSLQSGGITNILAIAADEPISSDQPKHNSGQQQLEPSKQSAGIMTGQQRRKPTTGQKAIVQEMTRSSVGTTVLPSHEEKIPKTYLLTFDEHGRLKKNNLKKTMKKQKKSSTSTLTYAVYQKEQKL